MANESSTKCSTPARAKAQPRRSHEVRSLILKAARELFTAQGYEATTTKDIAKLAGVLEPLLFTNFGNKAALFDAAVIEPFADLVADYADYWNRSTVDSTPEERITSFIESFYDLALRNRKLLWAAMAQQSGDLKAPGTDIFCQLAKVLHQIENVDALRVKYPHVDGSAAVTAVAGMVLGSALLDDRLFPPDMPKLSRSRIKAEMTNTVLHGMFSRSAATR